MKKAKQAKSSKIRAEGQFKGSRKRWWLEAAQQRSYADYEPPKFQEYQFDPELGVRFRLDDTQPSPRAVAEQFGDSSLGWHVEKILRGIHENLGTSR